MQFSDTSKTVIKLSSPIVAAYLGQSVMGVADTIMVGHLGATELAAVSLSNIIIHNALVFGIGLAMSLTPICGNLYARREHRRIAGFFQNSLLLNLITGLFLSLLLVVGSPLLWKIGQPEDVVEMALPFFMIVSISIIPNMLFLSYKQLLEGLGNTKLAMNITLSANAINLVLNYLLIYGVGSIEGLGVIGAALATFISRLYMLAAFYISFNRNKIYSRYLSFFAMSAFSLDRLRHLLKVGLPISFQITMEVMAFSITTVMIGWIGTEALAANQIVLSVISAVFMISNGIAGAITILVSHQMGLGNRRMMVRYTHAGAKLSVVIMGFSALCYILLGEQIAMLFTSDISVIKAAVPIFIAAAFFEISDGLQVTYLGALRGMTDVKRPMVYALFSYILINIPLSYLFGFIFDLGVVGIWMGFIFSLTISSVLFMVRFYKNVKKVRLNW